MRNEKEVKAIKQSFPVGSVIKLLCMREENNPVPAGTKGVVTGVDDIGTIHMAWENGRSLGLIVGEDDFILVERGG